jgi:hypothetical protein
MPTVRVKQRFRHILDVVTETHTLTLFVVPLLPTNCHDVDARHYQKKNAPISPWMLNGVGPSTRTVKVWKRGRSCPMLFRRDIVGHRGGETRRELDVLCWKVGTCRFGKRQDAQYDDDDYNAWRFLQGRGCYRRRP